MKSPICNVHTHIFNALYVPDKFTGTYFPYFKKVITLLLKTKLTSGIAIRILSRLGPGAVKYGNFIKIGRLKNQREVFEDLMQNDYPPNTRFVVLPLDFYYMGAGKIDKRYTYRNQLDEIMFVKRSYPDQLLPFVCIDPRRGTAKDNLEFVKYYIEKGFVGIKIYPSLGYFPYDKRLEKVYEYAEQNSLPIMTHCSPGGVYYANKKNIPPEFLMTKSFNEQEYYQINEKAGEKRLYSFEHNPELHLAKLTDRFLEPEMYVDALNKFPELKICFAHFGVDNHMMESFNEDKWNWFQQIKKLIKDSNYPNVYTDISYSLNSEKFLKTMHTLLEEETFKKHILFGTDYFMTILKKSEKELLHNAIRLLGEDKFDQIAYDNPAEYLTSKKYFYPKGE